MIDIVLCLYPFTPVYRSTVFLFSILTINPISDRVWFAKGPYKFKSAYGTTYSKLSAVLAACMKDKKCKLFSAIVLSRLSPHPIKYNARRCLSACLFGKNRSLGSFFSAEKHAGNLKNSQGYPTGGNLPPTVKLNCIWRSCMLHTTQQS